MKDYVILDLKGGLGNQLFILSLAKKLEKSGFVVLLDVSFYSQSNDYQRNVEVDLKLFQKKIISFNHDLIFKLLNRKIEEIDSIDELSIKKFTRFKGYYADANFIDKNYLLNTLNIQPEKQNNSLMIHIRRCDYEKLHIALSKDYFIRGIELFLNSSNLEKIDIFTDDNNFELADYSLQKFPINNIFKPNNMAPLETLKTMTSYQNYLISNSTFSFFAAYLGQKINSQVYYPKPWTRNNLFEIKNLPIDWIPIKNN